MFYRESKPPDALRHLVVSFWELQTEAGDPTVPSRIVADVYPEILIHRGNLPTVMSGGVLRQQDRCLFAGILTSPFTVNFPPGMHVIGARLQSWAVPHLFEVAPIEVSGLNDPVLSVNQYSSTTYRRLLEIAAVQDPIRHLQEWLLETASRHRRIEFQPIAHAIGLMYHHSGNVSLPRIAWQVNLSSRQLERHFLNQVGISPKRFARIVRFKSTMHHIIARPEISLAEVAAMQGFTDQSHLCHDFQQFAGITPSSVNSSADLASQFLAI